MTNNNKTLICKLTYCIHNNSCCASPIKEKENNSYCKLVKQGKEVNYQGYDGGCNMMEWNEDKKVQCMDCQIKKRGDIDMKYLNQNYFREMFKK